MACNLDKTVIVVMNSETMGCGPGTVISEGHLRHRPMFCGISGTSAKVCLQWVMNVCSERLSGNAINGTASCCVLSLHNVFDAGLRCVDKHRHHRDELGIDELRAWEGHIWGPDSKVTENLSQWYAGIYGIILRCVYNESWSWRFLWMVIREIYLCKKHMEEPRIWALKTSIQWFGTHWSQAPDLAWVARGA